MKPIKYVTLMHNPGAGNEGPTRNTLVSTLRGAGYHVNYQSMDDDDWKDALEDPGDLVVIAGGDGTVEQVCRPLIGRGVPVTLIPSGTANNISKTFGFKGSPQELVDGWKHAEDRPYDTGLAKGPWGEIPFLEAVGFGVLARMMAVSTVAQQQHGERYDSADERLTGAFRTLHDILPDYQSRHWDIKLDGEEVSGPYLLVEAMNIRSIGPNVALAPEADPGDGYFDVVLVTEAKRDAFAAYIQASLNGHDASPELPTRRGRRLEITWEGSEYHIDDAFWPETDADSAKPKNDEAPSGGRVEITLQPGALEFIVPKHR